VTVAEQQKVVLVAGRIPSEAIVKTFETDEWASQVGRNVVPIWTKLLGVCFKL
jgi:hypothetical protein